MTERFPRQRSRSAHHVDDAVFDDAFVAAAPVRELSAAERAIQRRLQAHRLPDQRADEVPLRLAPPRWTVRPSHRFTAIRPLPVIAATICVLTTIAFLVIVLR